MTQSAIERIVADPRKNLHVVRRKHCPTPPSLTYQQQQGFAKIPVDAISRITYVSNDFFYVVTSQDDFIPLPAACLTSQYFVVIA